MSRRYLSGAQKRKLAAEKKEKLEEELKKVPKISDIFSPKPTANVAGPSRIATEDNINTTNVLEENVSSEAAASTSEQNIDEDNIQNEDEFGESDDTIDFDDDNFNELFHNVSASSREQDVSLDLFPTDVALWDITADISALQRYWAKLGTSI